MKPGKLKKTFAWLPAICMIALGVVTASGISLIPAATAATDFKTVTVNATVGTAVSITTPCSTTSPTFTGTLTTAMGDTDTSDCVLTFGTNSATGAFVQVKDADNTAPFLCVYATSPTCNATVQFANSAANVSNMAEGAAGVRLKAVGAPAVAGVAWTLLNAGPVSGGGVYGDNICTTPGTAEGTCTVAFTADPSATQPASTGYTGTANFQASAN